MARRTGATLPRLGNAERAELKTRASHMLNRLRSHGAGPGGAVTRLAYTPEWAKAMEEVESWFDELDLEIEVDAVGNRFGRLRGQKEDTILTGSHIDSVSSGGAYDGAAGIVISTCAAGWLARTQGRPRRSLAVLACCEEESSRFPGNFWGSRAILGLIDPHEADRLRDRAGISIGDAMRACGLDPKQIPSARRSTISAFIECHIEQGPLLESIGAQIGIVEAIVGVRQRQFTFIGSTGHAGTIPLDQRRDALLAAAEFICAARRAGLATGGGAVATVGSILVRPGGANQIPGEAELTVDFRHPDHSALDRLENELMDASRAAAIKWRVDLSSFEQLNQAPVEMDRHLQDLLQQACQEVTPRFRRLASGAGHDAQVFARYVPSAMMFVPSKNGLSHRPDEATDIEDIVTGIEVLIRVLYKLAYLEA